MNPIVLLLALIFLTPLTSLGGNANYPESLSIRERAEVEQFLDQEVRADLAINWKDQLMELAGSPNSSQKEPKWQLPWGDPLDPATRDVIAEGIYQMLSVQMALYGGKAPNHDRFIERTGAILDYAARMGVVPTALTVGVMGRVQSGWGGSIGEQFNFYLDKGNLSMSTYGLIGAHAGFAAMAKLQFYIALCFGACFGGHATGWYLGMDVSADDGVGAGLFVEGGVILSDLIEGVFSKKHKMNLKEMYQTKAIYIGAGLDIGIGGGISADLFYYSLHDERILLRQDQMFGSNVSSSIKDLKLEVH